MRTRDKILILLVTVTLILGAVIFLYSGDNNTELIRFRWFLFNNPTGLVRDEVLSPANSTALWYGGIALAAIVMIGVVLRTAFGGELRAFRERLVQAEVAKAEVETLLQDTLWKEKHARSAKDAAVKDLEANLSRLVVLERQLTDNERILKIRDGELSTLRSQVRAVTEQPGKIPVAKLQEQGALRDELRKKTEALETKDSALKQLEKSLAGKVHALETQLSVKEKLLTDRDMELEVLRAQLINEGVAQTQAENLLAEELKKEQQLLQAKVAAFKEIEKTSSRKIQALESRLSEKQEALQNRTTELDALRAEVNAVTGKLADLESTREQAENAWQRELKQKTEILQRKEAAITQLEKSLSGKIQALESRLSEKQETLQNRTAELDALRAEMNAVTGKLADLESTRERAENAWQGELKQKIEILQKKELVINELQESLSTKIPALERQLTEKDKLLNDRAIELEAMRSEANTLAAAGSVKQRAEHVLQQELNKQIQALQAKDSAVKQLEERVDARIHTLEGQLTDKERLLKERDAELGAFRSKVGMLEEARSARVRGESALLEELKREKQTLQAKDSAMKELEKNLTAKLHAVEAQVREKQEALQNRSTDLEALRSEVNRLTERLADAGSAKQRAEIGLQQELKKKTELLQSKDAAIKELQANLSARVHALENQVGEKDAFLRTRDAEVDAVMARLTKMGAAKKEIENSLRAELGKTTEVLEAKDATIRELEESLNKTVAALENQLSEQETLLKGRDGEIEGLRSEMQALMAQLDNMRSVTERSEDLLQEGLSNGNGSNMEELEEDIKKVQALESLVKDKEDLLKIHDGKIERLEAELKAKRTEIARHQIKVWQSIERRTAWKHRLRKVGITLKD